MEIIRKENIQLLSDVHKFMCLFSFDVRFQKSCNGCPTRRLCLTPADAIDIDAGESQIAASPSVLKRRRRGATAAA